MPILTRQALYDLVWTQPMPALAETFGVPAAGFRKACGRAGVPLPASGYWSRLRAGKPVIKVALPPREPGAAATVSIHQDPSPWRRDLEAEIAEAIPDPPLFDEPLEAVRARVVSQVGEVSARHSLETVCAAIRKLLAEDDRLRAKQAADTWLSDGCAPRFDSPFERRRLQVLNSLAFGFARSGARLEIGDKAARQLAVRVGTQSVGFMLDHPTARPAHDGEWRTRPGPVDVLTLRMTAKYEDAGGVGTWTDDADGRIEDRLAEIIVSFIVAGEAQYRAATVSHRAGLIRRRAEAEAELAHQRAEAERKRHERQQMAQDARRRHLLGQAGDWRTAHDIRAFVTEVRAEDGEALGSGFEDWRAWALAEADAIDPVKRGLEPCMQDEADYKHPNCDCGFKCEAWCECGIGRACECECDFERQP